MGGQSMANEKEHEHNVEPIRGSVFVLTLKLALILFIIDSLYSLLFYLLNLGFGIPFDFHHHISVTLFITQIGKIIFEIFLIIYVVLQWANNTYFLTEKHLIRRTGILSTEEDVYHFENIRSITTHQSFLGRIFNYGDVILKTSASGGYQGEVTLTGISNPYKYENTLKKSF